LGVYEVALDEKIELKSISLFDPNGIYMEISEQNEIEK